jgi:threonine/homoserine/homoserine lactone efflux protein
VTSYLIQAAGFGLSAGTSFGPLHTLLMNVTLAQGWRAGLMLAMIPLLTDAPIVLLMLFVLRAMPPAAVPLLNIVGGIAVFVIAFLTYRGLRAPVAAAVAPKVVARDTLLKGAAVNFLNPGPYIFWGTITGPLFLEALSLSVAAGLGFLATFYGTFVGLMAIFVVIFDRLRGVDPRLTRALSYGSIAILTYLGSQLLLKGLNGLQT